MRGNLIKMAKTFRKGLKKYQKINLIEEKGNLLEEYPTDSFDGSNTGDASLHCFKGKIFEINRERDGNKVTLGEVSRSSISEKLSKKCPKGN